MKSAFMSDLFHAARAGEGLCLPVSPEATMWLMSLRTVARNILHALGVEAGEPYAITLPALRVEMEELVAEVCRQTGADPCRFGYAPDETIEADFGRYPPLFATQATSLGFSDDGDLRALVGRALAAVPGEEL